MQTFPAMPVSCKDDRCSMLSAPFSDSDSTDSQQVPSSFVLRCEMPTAPTPLPKKESGVSVNTRDDTSYSQPGTWVFSLVPLVYISVFVPVAYFLYDCNFVV